MPARRVKTFKKELGHRQHRDHRTRRRPLSKKQRGLRNDHRKRTKNYTSRAVRKNARVQGSAGGTKRTTSKT